MTSKTKELVDFANGIKLFFLLTPNSFSNFILLSKTSKSS